MNTLRFFARRAAFYLFTAWAAITINFFLPRFMKGDPVQAYLGRHRGNVTPEAIDSLRILFGLNSDRSLLQQYVDYWGLMFSGDLGRSFSRGLAPVTDVIASALPWTVGLVGIATILSFVIGTCWAPSSAGTAARGPTCWSPSPRSSPPSRTSGWA